MRTAAPRIATLAGKPKPLPSANPAAPADGWPDIDGRRRMAQVGPSIRLRAMTQALAELTPAGWLERLAQLAVRHRLHLSPLQQRDGRDLELVFASATLHVPADRLLDERSVNEVLKGFLAGAGVIVAHGHV